MKNWILFLLTIVAVFLLAMLATIIMDRKAEARFAYQSKVNLEGDGIEPRDSVWGLNYPRQYQSYMKTVDTTFSSVYNTSDHHISNYILQNPILWKDDQFFPKLGK